MKSARLVSLLVVLALSGCASWRKGSGDHAAGGGSDSDYVSGSPLGTPLPERREGVSFLGGNVDRSRFSPVYFGYDSANVPGSERGKLQGAFLGYGGVAATARPSAVTASSCSSAASRASP